MSFRINTNTISEIAQTSLRKSKNEQQSAMEKLSSGKRINKAADDASGLAMASKMETEISGSRQAKRNASDGISLVQIAEGGLNEVTGLLTRMRELSVQSASDTLSKEDRSYVETEFKQLSDEVDRISNITKFNGVSLINGSSDQESLSFHVGSGSGKENIIEFDIEEINVSADSLGIDGVSVSSKSNALDSMQEIDTALSSVNKHRAFLGSMQRRLESAANTLDTSIVNKEAAKSRILDADIAKESSELVTANIKTESGISVLSQANMAARNVRKLIG